MLVCSVSLRPPGRTIAGDLAEVVTAADALATGNVVFATLVDDPASVLDTLDAYSGEIMIETASAADTVNGSVPAVYAADIVEAITAAHAQDGTVGAILWAPSDLTTLKLWLKGDSNTGSDGSAITTWTDASGQGNNATGAGGNPIVAAANQNGLNTVRFLGATGQYFQLPNFLTAFSAGSVIMVLKLVSDPPFTSNDGGFVKFGSDLSGNANNYYPYQGDHHWYEDFGSAARVDMGSPAISLSAWHIVSIHAAANDLRSYFNGTSFYTSTTNTVGWFNTPRIGRGGGGSSPFPNGWMAELVFVNEVLSTGDRQKLEGYLAYKWGIQSVLDSAHPYKTTPPPSTPPFPTFDAATVTAATLSNGNLTATNTGTTSFEQGAHVPNTVAKSTGKYYFEMTFTTMTSGGSYGVGVAVTGTLFANASVTGAMNFRGGSIFSNSVQNGTGTGAASNGNIIRVAVDLDNRRIWFNNGSSNWNGSGSADPATNAGGVTLISGSLLPYVTFGGAGGSSGNVITANFGATAFSYAVPSGFTSGWL